MGDQLSWTLHWLAYKGVRSGVTTHDVSLGTSWTGLLISRLQQQRKLQNLWSDHGAGPPWLLKPVWWRHTQMHMRNVTGHWGLQRTSHTLEDRTRWIILLAKFCQYVSGQVNTLRWIMSANGLSRDFLNLEAIKSTASQNHLSSTLGTGSLFGTLGWRWVVVCHPLVLVWLGYWGSPLPSPSSPNFFVSSIFLLLRDTVI